MCDLTRTMHSGHWPTRLAIDEVRVLIQFHGTLQLCSYKFEYPYRTELSKHNKSTTNTQKISKILITVSVTATGYHGSADRKWWHRRSKRFVQLCCPLPFIPCFILLCVSYGRVFKILCLQINTKSRKIPFKFLIIKGLLTISMVLVGSSAIMDADRLMMSYPPSEALWRIQNVLIIALRREFWQTFSQY